MSLAPTSCPPGCPHEEKTCERFVDWNLPWNSTLAGCDAVYQQAGKDHCPQGREPERNQCWTWQLGPGLGDNGEEGGGEGRGLS